MKKYFHMIMFYCIIFFALFPLLVFPFISKYYHEIYDLPEVKNGVLDLTNFNVESSKPIPLDGQWEYFDGQWIVSDMDKKTTKSTIVTIPYEKNILKLHNNQSHPEQISKASYRLLVLNSPKDIVWLAELPKRISHYKIFINGALVDSDLYFLSQNFFDLLYHRPLEGVAIPVETVGEIVIEVKAASRDAISGTPVLWQGQKAHANAYWRNNINAAFNGIMIASVLFFGIIILIGAKSRDSMWLLLLNILVLISMLINTKVIALYLNWNNLDADSIIATFLAIRIAVLPTLFLYSSSQLIKVNLKKKDIIAVVVYEMITCLLSWYFMVENQVMLMIIFNTLCYLPFLFIFFRLYQWVKEKAPYAVVVTAILSFILAGLIISGMNLAGFFVMDVALFPATCFIISMLLQIITYLMRNLKMQKKVAENEMLQVRLRESEIAMALSQIKPHFLYNALIGIQVLCTQEPELAAETTLQFANYMRENMRFLSMKEPIPFTRELAHIKNYVAIEKTRFQERLNVEFDVDCQDFFVPPLSIQPIIENAIKHGVCKKAIGGTVVLKSYEKPDAYIIEIEDDGCGFDTNHQKEASDSVGIANIQFRLKEWMNAQLIIESEVDKGTKVLVVIPKEVFE